MTKTYNFRLPPETISQLDELTRAYGTNRTAFIIFKIAQEYEALQGNPKTKKMLQAMRDCAQILREATGGATELDDPVQLALDTVGALYESESPEKGSHSPEKASWYGVHPQGDFVSLDPDEDLPL